MRLNQIRDFVSIVEAGSIRAAARTLGVSHPAMTKALRQLEEENRKLKQLVADLSLDKHMLQEVVRKKL